MKNIFFNLAPSLEHKFFTLLNDGTEFLNLNLGIISRIYNEVYRVYGVSNNTMNILVGDDFELSKTYCLDILNRQKTLYYQDVAKITGMEKHPCYITTQLRAYIGTPILIEGRFWGTLNYSALEPTKLHYSEEDLKYIQNQAQEITELLLCNYQDPFELK